MTAKMIGKYGHPPCGSRCCGNRYRAFTRRMKRRERAQWKREASA